MKKYQEHPRSNLITLGFFKLRLGCWSLILSILTLIALAACGSTNDEHTPTAPGAEEVVTDIMPAVSNGDGPVTSSGTEKIFVGPDQFDHVIISLVAGDILKMAYTTSVSISPGLGGTSHQERGVLLVVLDPLEDQLFTAEAMATNTVEVAAEISGQHQIVFINPNRLEGIIVNLEYSINS